MNTAEQGNNAKQLKGRFTVAVLVFFIALLAAMAATYAWYVYNTGRHTTKVRMAAGTGINLQISDKYDDETAYKSSTMLESFTGKLNPVSTNRIQDGFRKVFGFTNGKENQPNLVANLFGDAEYSDKYKDYYKTSLYLRSNGESTDVYISDITFEDSSEEAPISSAIRVGFVVHQPAVTVHREHRFRWMCISGWRGVMRTAPQIFAIRPCKNWQFPLQVWYNKEKC